MAIKEALGDIPRKEFLCVNALHLRKTPSPTKIPPADAMILQRTFNPLAVIGDTLASSPELMHTRYDRGDTQSMRTGSYRLGISLIIWFSYRKHIDKLTDEDNKAITWLRSLDTDEVITATETYLLQEADEQARLPDGEDAITHEVVATSAEFPALHSYAVGLEDLLSGRGIDTETVGHMAHGALIGAVVIRELIEQQNFEAMFGQSAA